MSIKSLPQALGKLHLAFSLVPPQLCARNKFEGATRAELGPQALVGLDSDVDDRLLFEIVSTTEQKQMRSAWARPLVTMVFLY